MSDRQHPGEGSIPENSYAAWWAQAQEQDAEAQRLQAQLDQQAAAIVQTIEERG